jgi:hypothetical protein
MKICSKCKEEKELDCFNKHKYGVTSWCKDCVKNKSKQHYLDNKEKQILKNKQYNEQRKKWFYDYKSTLKCERCNENHIACLDFHHINPNDKKFQISEGLIQMNKSKEEILKEISKCIVLCSNCHRKEHWNLNIEI